MPAKKPGVPVWVYVVGAFVVLAIIGAMLPRQDFTSTTRSGVSNTPAKSSVFRAGEAAIIRVPGSSIATVATDAAAMEEVHRVFRAKDKIGLMNLVKDDRAFIVNGGSAVRVISPGIMLTEIEMRGGEHDRKRGVIASEFLTSE